MRRMLEGWIIAVVIALAATSGAAMQITECGGTIPAHEKAILQNDVVCQYRCTGDGSICDYGTANQSCGRRKGFCEPEQFVLEHGATLDLNGHTINFAYQRAGAVCGTSFDEEGRCVIKGPGTIQGGKGTGIAGHSMEVIVKNITISVTDGAISTRGRLIANGLVIPHDRENTLYAAKGMALTNVHFDGESGVQSDGDIVLAGVEIGPHDGGTVAAGRLRGRNVTISGHRGITARDIALRHATSGPDASGDTASNASATHSLRLVDSNVVTIESGSAPVLVRSSCDTSKVLGSSSSWGVCAND